MKRSLLLLLLLLLTLPAVSQDQEIRLISVNHRPAADLLPMVRPLLSPNGTVVADPGISKLLVRDTPAVLAKVEALVRSLDVRTPQVRVRVALGSGATFVNRGAGVLVNGQPGIVVNSNGPNNVTVFGNNTHSTVNASSEMSLVALSGSQAYLRVVEATPHIGFFVQYAAQHGYIAPGVFFTEVGTGFSVSPRVAGDTVIMRIAPFIAYRSPAGDGTITFQEAATEISTRSGNTVSFTASSSTSDLFRFILGSVNSSSSVNATYHLTPEIMPE